MHSTDSLLLRTYVHTSLHNYLSVNKFITIIHTNTTITPLKICSFLTKFTQASFFPAILTVILFHLSLSLSLSEKE